MSEVILWGQPFHSVTVCLELIRVRSTGESNSLTVLQLFKNKCLNNLNYCDTSVNTIFFSCNLFFFQSLLTQYFIRFTVVVLPHHCTAPAYICYKLVLRWFICTLNKKCTICQTSDLTLQTIRKYKMSLHLTRRITETTSNIFMCVI